MVGQSLDNNSYVGGSPGPRAPRPWPRATDPAPPVALTITITSHQNAIFAETRFVILSRQLSRLPILSFTFKAGTTMINYQLSSYSFPQP